MRGARWAGKQLGGRGRRVAEPAIRFDGQLVATIVFRVAAVSSDTCVMHVMLCSESVELLPQFDVLYRYPLARTFTTLPVIAFPFGHPFAEALADIHAIGEKFDLATSFECLKPLDNRHQFHAIVRGLHFGTGAFLLLSGTEISEDICPSARPGVSTTGPVSKEMNLSRFVGIGQVKFSAISSRVPGCLGSSPADKAGCCAVAIPRNWESRRVSAGRVDEQIHGTVTQNVLPCPTSLSK